MKKIILLTAFTLISYCSFSQVAKDSTKHKQVTTKPEPYKVTDSTIFQFTAKQIMSGFMPYLHQAIYKKGSDNFSAEESIQVLIDWLINTKSYQK